MSRLRPLAVVGLLLLTGVGALADPGAAAADGPQRPVVQRSQLEASPPPVAEAGATASAQAADADDGDGAVALLLAGLGAVGLVASRLRRAD